MIRPQIEMPQDSTPIHNSSLDNYAYQVGPQIFFVPVTESNVIRTPVTFPESHSAWYSFADHSQTFQGGHTYEIDVPLDQPAAFGACGQILPLHVSTSILGNGDAESKDAYTFLVHTPDMSGLKVSQEVRRARAEGFDVTYQGAEQADGRKSLTFAVSAVEENVIFLIKNSAL